MSAPQAQPPGRFKRLLNSIGWLFSRARQRAKSDSSLEQDVREFGEDLLALADELNFLPKRQQIRPVRNQFYGHGAFMGAAPMLFAEERWRRILAFLMPDVYREAHEKLQAGASGQELIPMFENNPVMCAFGIWTGLRTRERLHQEHSPGEHDLSGIEWDVFVNGELIDQWLKAAPAQQADLMNRIVDTMVIAHASTTDTVQEQLGFDQYGDVRRTSKTSLGGVEANAWMDLFARSLELAEAGDLQASLNQMAREPRIETGDECQKHTFAQPMDYHQATERFTQLTAKPYFSVILEMKSLSSTPEILRGMVAELNQRGVHVAAVCSFVLAEVQGVSQMTQVIKDQSYPGPREILFFHFAGNLQQACDRQQLPPGQSVLFNGGSLLELSTSGPLPYQLKDEVIEDLGLYKARGKLHIGLYVQESDCDPIAAGLLSELVDARADIFDLGFAWGGLQDEALAQLEQAQDLRGLGSQRLLEYVGRAIHWEVNRSLAQSEQAEEAGSKELS